RRCAGRRVGRRHRQVAADFPSIRSRDQELSHRPHLDLLMAGARRPRRRTPSVAARSLAGVAGAPAGLGWRRALIVLVTVLVYWNSLGNPFVFDDNITLANNPQIRSLASVFHTDKGSALTGRPIVSLTFAANYAIGG